MADQRLAWAADHPGHYLGVNEGCDGAVSPFLIKVEGRQNM